MTPEGIYPDPPTEKKPKIVKVPSLEPSPEDPAAGERGKVIAVGGMLTDTEYTRLLQALARKHLRPFANASELSEGKTADKLQQIMSATRLWKVARQDMDPVIVTHFAKQLGENPVKVANQEMRESGILDALDDAPSLTFGGLRRSVIPTEDTEFLRRAGFDDDDTELLLVTSMDAARILATAHKQRPSQILEEAADVLARCKSKLANADAPKKRKILNGIGKMLGGAVTGVGNVLLALGTLTAPNPATGYGAVASGALAVSSIFCGLGDLRGE